MTGPAPEEREDRRYPDRPIAGVGAVAIHDRRVVLIRRRFEPLAGEWSLPGGRLELGETLREAVRRELREETGLEGEVGPLIEIFEPILRDADGRIRHQYVIVDYLCRVEDGTPVAGSDVSDVALADPDDLSVYGLTSAATRVIARGVEMAKEAGWWPPGPDSRRR
ncbi:MAG: NUDIX hydrolase [Acidobacteriota bacterium]|nr:NUDIX hydrolase [Acidobacteriota bacterium]